MYNARALPIRKSLYDFRYQFPDVITDNGAIIVTSAALPKGGAI